MGLSSSSSDLVLGGPQADPQIELLWRRHLRKVQEGFPRSQGGQARRGSDQIGRGKEGQQITNCWENEVVCIWYFLYIEMARVLRRLQAGGRLQLRHAAAPGLLRRVQRGELDHRAQGAVLRRGDRAQPRGPQRPSEDQLQAQAQEAPAQEGPRLNERQRQHERGGARAQADHHWKSPAAPMIFLSLKCLFFVLYSCYLPNECNMYDMTVYIIHNMCKKNCERKWIHLRQNA